MMEVVVATETWITEKETVATTILCGISYFEKIISEKYIKV